MREKTDMEWKKEQVTFVAQYNDKAVTGFER